MRFVIGYDDWSGGAPSSSLCQREVTWILKNKFVGVSSSSNFVCPSVLQCTRDVFDLSKDNLHIKERKTQGIYISGSIEVRRKKCVKMGSCCLTCSPRRLDPLDQVLGAVKRMRTRSSP